MTLIPAKKILDEACNLDIKNPRAKEDLQHLPLEQLVEDIVSKEQNTLSIMSEIKALLPEGVN